jgi:hypothetical protein
MFKSKTSYLLLLFFLLQFSFIYGQMPLAKTAKISILTCDKKNKLILFNQLLLIDNKVIRIVDK